MGHPLLALKCHEVSEFNTPELHGVIQDMIDTMKAENGAGLAANQIGIPLRIVVFGFEHNPRYPDAEPVPETVLINPVIEVLDDQMDYCWEGCLSVPGMRGMVPRNKNIRYRGYDQYGNKIERTAHNFHARVVQHECDHLDGILFIDKLPPLKKKMLKGKLTAISKCKVDVDYKIKVIK